MRNTAGSGTLGSRLEELGRNSPCSRTAAWESALILPHRGAGYDLGSAAARTLLEQVHKLIGLEHPMLHLNDSKAALARRSP